MDKQQLLSVMHDAFKSLTVSNIEILELDGKLMTVRIVAESYALLNIPERVELITDLLRKTSAVVSLNYAVSFEPLMPTDFSERYDKGNAGNWSGSSDSGGIAAKDVEI